MEGYIIILVAFKSNPDEHILLSTDHVSMHFIKSATSAPLVPLDKPTVNKQN